MGKRVRQLLAQEEERSRKPIRGVSPHGSISLWVCQALAEELDGDPLVSGVVMDSSKPTQRLGAQ